MAFLLLLQQFLSEALLPKPPLKGLPPLLFQAPLLSSFSFLPLALGFKFPPIVFLESFLFVGIRRFWFLFMPNVLVYSWLPILVQGGLTLKAALLILSVLTRKGEADLVFSQTTLTSQPQPGNPLNLKRRVFPSYRHSNPCSCPRP